jgi:PilZ domain
MKPPRNSPAVPRRENRIQMEIPVVLHGHLQVPGVESTFTENVSAKGARVVSVRRWEKDSQLVLASRTGEFRSAARVAYCQSVRGDGYVIGLEFLEPVGRWVVQSSN